MIRTAAIVDGYVDEPACFGVPPYISPYIRYCAGTFARYGVEASCVECDEWRADRERWDDVIAGADITVVIMGLTVPGRYRGGSPLTMRELAQIAALRRRGPLAVGGPIRAGYAMRGGEHAKKIFPDGVDFIAHGDVEASIERYILTGEWDDDARRRERMLEEIAPLGAYAARGRRGYPNVIAEIEISRGCDRTDGRCSFCTEGVWGAYDERGVAEVASEVRALRREGVKAFRLGRCANILAYGGERTDRGVRPNGARLAELYGAIREAAPDLEVLHTDNCSPATVAHFPLESAHALWAIAWHCTEGDGLSLGIESLDPKVIAANSLKVDAREAFAAVKLINEVGSFRKAGGLPTLLPGLNFISGLAGETNASSAHDEAFLRRLLDEGLSVRRINVRRAMVFDGAPLAQKLNEHGMKPSAKERAYRKWRDFVREEVDPEMMRRVAPDGTIIRGVILEEQVGSVAFGRPLGSYPPLVGVPGTHEIASRVDVTVCGRGGRSLTAVVRPLDPNSCSRAELESLPEIGRARADKIIASRPFGDKGIKKILDEMDSPGISKRLSCYFE